MTTPRKLSRPPITEALIDIRSVISAPQEVLTTLADEFTTEFPQRKITQTMSAKLEIREGKLVPPELHEGGFHGVHVFNEAGTLAVQFRLDGFTFNNIGQFVGGSRLLDEGLRYWQRFVDGTHPTAVTRIAMRYINTLDLPFKEGDSFDRFLAAAPELPPPAPQGVSEFHSRLVARDILTPVGEKTWPTAIVTQQLKHDPAGRPLVTLDVDIFKMGEFSVSSVDLRREFDELREFKNRTFFSLLTEETVKLYE